MGDGAAVGRVADVPPVSLNVIDLVRGLPYQGETKSGTHLQGGEGGLAMAVPFLTEQIQP